MPAPNFDKRAERFSKKLRAAADWKVAFYGAAYSTRIRQAINAARAACDEAERLLEEDNA